MQPSRSIQMQPDVERSTMVSYKAQDGETVCHAQVKPVAPEVQLRYAPLRAPKLHQPVLLSSVITL